MLSLFHLLITIIIPFILLIPTLLLRRELTRAGWSWLLSYLAYQINLPVAITYPSQDIPFYTLRILGAKTLTPSALICSGRVFNGEAQVDSNYPAGSKRLVEKCLITTNRSLTLGRYMGIQWESIYYIREL